MAKIKKVVWNEITKNEKEKKGKTNTSLKTQLRPWSNYFINKADIDPFPNPSLLDLPYKNQDPSSRKAVEAMLSYTLAQRFSMIWRLT